MTSKLYLIAFAAMVWPTYGQIAEDFEPGIYTLSDPMSTYTGWAVSAGTASLSEAEAAAGTQSVVLTGGATVAEVTRTVQAAEWATAPIAFADVYILPVADDAVSPVSTLEISGSPLAFLKVSDGGSGSEGAVYAVDGIGASGPENVDTNHRFAINGNDEAAEWIRVTIRQDYTNQTYDLYINGVMLVANLDFDTGSLITEPVSFYFAGDDTRDVYIDNLGLGEVNPLFDDADFDGISDHVERALGLNPGVNDRALDLDGDTVTNLAELLAGTPPNQSGSYAAITGLLYVDGAHGSDAFNGKAPYDTGTDGPKASLNAAISASTTGGTVTLLPIPAGYTQTTLGLSGKDITLRPAGDVSIK